MRPIGVRVIEMMEDLRAKFEILTRTAYQPGMTRTPALTKEFQAVSNALDKLALAIMGKAKRPLWRGSITAVGDSLVEGVPRRRRSKKKKMAARKSNPRRRAN